ncbi:MAG: hypothetical protein H8E31_06900 [Planctomycetes bacterium]|nr:hypothetical protein [Planctomycetota bacterium]
MPRFLLPLILTALAAGALVWLLGFADRPAAPAPAVVEEPAEAVTPAAAADAPETTTPDPPAVPPLPDLEPGANRAPVVESEESLPEADLAAPEGPTARLRVRALRPDGRVWPLLALRLGWHDGRRPRESRGLTDLFGSYEIDLPARLEELQLAWGDGRQAAFELRSFSVALRAWSTTVLVIEPRPPGTLLGTLVDAGGGAIAGATVCLDPKEPRTPLWRLANDPDQALAVTRLDGSFELGGVAGSCWLRFLLPSGAVATAMASLPEGGTTDQEFRLPRWRSLAVRVVDAREQPLAGAELDAGAYHWGSKPGVTTFHSARARSGGDGWARFPQVADDEIPLGARLPGYQDWDGKLAPGLASTVVTLADAWTVEGQVFAANGEPAAGAAVLLWVEEEEGDSIRQPRAGSWTAQQAGEDGRFRLRLRTSGRRGALLARGPGLARGVLWPLQLGPLVRGVVIGLGPESPLAGRVLLPNGEGLRGADISARPVEPPWAWTDLHGGAVPTWSSRTLGWDRRQPLDADGGFDFLGLPAGLYDFEVRSLREGGVLALARRGSSNRDIRIYLGEGTEQLVHFDFQVSDGAKGPPLTDFEIVITGTEVGGRSILSRRVLSTDGLFSWEGFLPGSYWIDVRASGFRDFGRVRQRYSAGRHFIDAALTRPERG